MNSSQKPSSIKNTNKGYYYELLNYNIKFE